MFLIAGISITLPFAVIGLAITAGYYVWLMFNGFPIGWGVAGVLYCLWYMGGGYKMMTFFNQEGSARNNGHAAACLPFVFHLFLAIYFSASDFFDDISAMWALLLPATLLLHMLLQSVFDVVFDWINPSGRRR
jgi:hypothetical protein